MTFKHFRAKVLVEKYASPGHVEVHFFAGGKARVVAGWPTPQELKEEILAADSHAATTATVGEPVNDMFFKEELDAMRRRDEERKRKSWGDWR